MNFKEQTTKLNEEQKIALDELKQKNKNLIEEVKKVSQVYNTSIASFHKDMTTF